MFTFSCQCQSCRGNLVATEKEFYFTSSVFRIDLDWSNVKRIRLETQQVKGVPTSVLVVVLQRSEAIVMLSPTPSAQKKRFLSSRKYFFYDFHDLLGAEEQIKHFMEQYRASERSKKDEARDDLEKGSSATTKPQTDKADEKGEVSSSSSDAPKDESLNNSRTTPSRNPELDTRRTTVGLSFARRATPSTSSRSKLAGKLVTIPLRSPPRATSGKYARLFLKVYQYVAAVLVVVMLALLTRHYVRFGGLHVQKSSHTAEKLLRDIHALSDVNIKLESYNSQESLRQYNKRRKDLSKESRSYMHQLEQAAVELMERYVALQTKMATLRGHRAQRIAREQQSGTQSPPLPSIMSSAFGTPKTTTDRAQLFSQRRGAYKSRAGNHGAARTGVGQCGNGEACKKARRRRAAPHKMSLSRLRSGVQRWVHRMQSGWNDVTSFRSAPAMELFTAPTPSTDGHHDSMGGAAWMIYTEEMGEDFQLTEWVSAAEYEDRHSCRLVTQELLETVEVTEHVFATFSSMFLMDRYRKLESREERASHWMQPPQALHSVPGSSKYYAAKAFSSEEVAHVAMLRRFVGSLLHNEPLEANHARRRSTALRVANAMLHYRQREVQLLRARNQGSPNNATELWRLLEEEVLRPTTTSLRGNPDIDESAMYLRNSIAELSFWYRHEVAWHEHVLSFFTPEEQAEIRSSLGTVDRDHRRLGGRRAHPIELHWMNLPLFRGLLCFEGVPYLQGDASGVDDDAAAEGATVDALQEEEKGETEEGAGDIGESRAEKLHLDAITKRTTAPSSPSVILAHWLPRPPERNKTSFTNKKAPLNHTPNATPTPSQTPETSLNAAASLPEQRSKDTDLWKELKLRWMADLDVFRLTFNAQLAGHNAHGASSYCTDEEEHGVVAGVAETRCRLFELLSLVNEIYVLYLIPTVAQRFGAFLRALFPPYFNSPSGNVYISALRSWGKQDPAVQLAIAQVTGFAPGTTSDISRSLLYLVLQPPPLLQTSVTSTRQTTAAVIVLLLFLGVLTALYVMH
ncbi:hypothetical protein MNV84_06474 [Leishmania braziliensis]|nr:hypothetical protein MNV84_06474 [Leishmania braziliensis]